MALRIIIDDSAAFNQGAGIGRYARNLVPALVNEMPEAKFVLWYAPEPQAGARFRPEALAHFAGNRKVRSRQCRLDRRRMDQLWFRARLPIPMEFWTGRGDLVYSPDFTAPPSLGRPSIMTVHDLAFLIVPERAPKALRDYLSAVVPRQIRNSAAIVAVSETTKLDLMERLRVEPDRITVVPNAADQRFFDALPLNLEERSLLGLPEQYLLTVGTIEPRKNHATLFEALRMVAQSTWLPLVVVGRVGWAADEIMTAARQLELDGRVILLDYVDDRLLPGLYTGASAIVYPSWYEGFGLPVLEGMASGTRVIASDVPAHREISAGTIHLVDPADAGAIAHELERAVTETETESSRARRIERSRFYSWSQSGERLSRLVKDVIKT